MFPNQLVNTVKLNGHYIEIDLKNAISSVCAENLPGMKHTDTNMKNGYTLRHVFIRVIEQ